MYPLWLLLYMACHSKILTIWPYRKKFVDSHGVSKWPEILLKPRLLGPNFSASDEVSLGQEWEFASLKVPQGADAAGQGTTVSNHGVDKSWICIFALSIAGLYELRQGTPFSYLRVGSFVTWGWFQSLSWITVRIQWINACKALSLVPSPQWWVNEMFTIVMIKAHSAKGLIRCERWG